MTSYDGHSGNVNAVGFEREGRWMYSGSDDGTVKIWDLRAGGYQREYESRGAVTCAALHPNQARPVIALVHIRPSWRGERRSLRTSPGDSLRPGSLGFDPDARAATPFDSA